MRDSMVGIIQSLTVTLETVALAAEVISADARFNLWLATKGKHDPDTRMLELVDMYEAASEECRKIADALEGDQSQCQQRLQDVAAILNAARK